jgi:phosphoribosyl-dephospho-CoA transferase
MFLNKGEKKKRHPYRGLAMFTLAAAGMISVTSRMKKIMKEKVEKMTAFLKKTADE